MGRDDAGGDARPLARRRRRSSRGGKPDRGDRDRQGRGRARSPCVRHGEPRLAVEAGRRAAATAGARIVASFAGVLDASRAKELMAARPDVVLLTGGMNGGDRTAIVQSARTLAAFADAAPAIVVAGNEEA